MFNVTITEYVYDTDEVYSLSESGERPDFTSEDVTEDLDLETIEEVREFLKENNFETFDLTGNCAVHYVYHVDGFSYEGPSMCIEPVATVTKR